MILCWFTRGFGISLILDCFFSHVLMLSLHFLQVASHCHFLSVLDLCVFSCVAQSFCFLCRQDFAHLRRGCFIQGGVQIQCLLHDPAVVSKLFQVRRKKHNVHGRQKYKPACGDPWRGDSQACSVLSKKSLKRQFVDDHHPSPAYTATERDYLRTKPP